MNISRGLSTSTDESSHNIWIAFLWRDLNRILAIPVHARVTKCSILSDCYVPAQLYYPITNNNTRHYHKCQSFPLTLCDLWYKCATHWSHCKTFALCLINNVTHETWPHSDAAYKGDLPLLHNKASHNLNMSPIQIHILTPPGRHKLEPFETKYTYRIAANQRSVLLILQRMKPCPTQMHNSEETCRSCSKSLVSNSKGLKPHILHHNPQRNEFSEKNRNICRIHLTCQVDLHLHEPSPALRQQLCPHFAKLRATQYLRRCTQRCYKCIGKHTCDLMSAWAFTCLQLQDLHLHRSSTKKAWVNQFEYSAQDELYQQIIKGPTISCSSANDWHTISLFLQRIITHH